MKRSALSLSLIFALSAAVCAQKSIRNVDFRNFTYQSQCAEDKPYPVEVTDGVMHRQTLMQGPNLHWIYKVDQIFYADIDGDGREDAVIASECHYSQSDGSVTNGGEILVYSTKNGKPILLGRTEQLIDTPYIKDLSAKNKILFVTYGHEQIVSRRLQIKYTLRNGILDLVF